jgi:hypothetical protein
VCIVEVDLGQFEFARGMNVLVASGDEFQVVVGGFSGRG